MAFVLVQHLAPDHKSILTDLIKRYTRMHVYEVEDGVIVQPNCAYIIPPNHDMAFLNGTLQLLEPGKPRGLRLPIDFFFRSLAQDQRERAICIVLSGTGSDGSLGIRAVKGEGGMVMAQNPETTEYDGMPRSAIATGMVDYVLPPNKMAAQLVAFTAGAYHNPLTAISPVSHRAEDLYKKIFVVLRAKTGHDFSLYKQNTITRRVQRRMAVQQINQLDGYLRYLQQTPAEVEALFRDLLIGVTNFFRDPKVFEVLEQQLIPRLFAEKSSGESIRIWVAGCSTGEEAYSLAILLQEQMDALKKNFKLQIFATDIDNQAVAKARTGIFPANITEDVSAERLARFFDLQPGGNFRIHKDIRDQLVFSEHDLIKDPPFSKLDLLCCRNVMIYMGTELQKKLMPLFHYALNPGGSLLLGTSESFGNFLNLFTSLDRKAKLYQRKPESSSHYHPIIENFNPLAITRAAASLTGETMSAIRLPAQPLSAENKLPLRELTERILLRKYAPTSILVNDRGEIQYLHGRSGRYLEPAQGDPDGLTNILKLAREGLRSALITALHKAATHHELVTQSGLRVKTNGDFSTVNLIVQPVAAGSASEAAPNLFMIILEEVSEAEQASLNTALSSNPAEVDARITALKQELIDKDEYIQNSNEELETTNEELKSSNEEMQSVNEELQSTNEELETAKEELQSVNEELSTVNAELQQRVMDLSRVNNDMSNLMSSTGVGTIFVNYQLVIQRFTTSITPIINLIPGDIGRSVGDIASSLVGYDRLLDDVRAVLDSLIPRDIEVQTRAGLWYLLRIQPYRTSENVIEGAVINFTEISELKKAQAARQETEGLRRLAAVVRDAHDAILVQDLSGRILAWNPGAEKMYGWSEPEALALNIRDLVPETQRKEALAMVRQLSRGQALEPYRILRITKSGQTLEVWLTATALLDGDDEMYAIATTERATSL
ncbi:MAG: CheR family methyltransferase [Chloroflexota bacterium]